MSHQRDISCGAIFGYAPARLRVEIVFVDAEQRRHTEVGYGGKGALQVVDAGDGGLSDQESQVRPSGGGYHGTAYPRWPVNDDKIAPLSQCQLTGLLLDYGY